MAIFRVFTPLPIRQRCGANWSMRVCFHEKLTVAIIGRLPSHTTKQSLNFLMHWSKRLSRNHNEREFSRSSALIRKSKQSSTGTVLQPLWLYSRANAGPSQQAMHPTQNYVKLVTQTFHPSGVSVSNIHTHFAICALPVAAASGMAAGVRDGHFNLPPLRRSSDAGIAFT